MSVGMAAPARSMAATPIRSRGRLFAEPPSRTRSPFRRDCDRVIHSTAFRRLKHKTQVFVFHEGDHYRTRLTHSLEVAQIARALARQLGARRGSDAKRWRWRTTSAIRRSAMPASGRWTNASQAHGGFDHNAQTLRVVTSLEHRYPEFDGLNLTWETLEGIVKHNGPLTEPERGAGRALPRKRHSRRYLPISIKNYDLELWSYASLEAQAAAFADDIAYDAHDIDDGLRAGLFGVDDLKVMPLTASDHRGDRPALSQSRRRQARRGTGARADFLP